jgi:hypothetical protein
MSAYIAVELQHRVRQHFGNCCAYCRTAENLTAVTFEFEHIVPRSDGGVSEFENLCLACPSCNRYKSDLTVASDPVTQEPAGLFHPQRHMLERTLFLERRGHGDPRVDAHGPGNNRCSQNESSADDSRAADVGGDERASA